MSLHRSREKARCVTLFSRCMLWFECHTRRTSRKRMAFISEISWRPTIGDPSFMGWFTVVAYAMAAALAALAGWGKPGGDSKLRGRRNRLWLAVAVVMVCLCIN